jgi:tripartite-type tricarboxylate transporter receptor subunit TctC
MKKIITSALLTLAVATTAMADYPSKTIKLVVPSKAGGSTDTTARLFIDTAKKYWKDSDFIVVNKPGAGGLIGFSYEQRQKADGYTFGLMFTPQFVAHIVSKKAKYTLDSFNIIGNIAQDPGIVVVNADSSIKSLDDLVEVAKTKKITAAVNGIGSDDFLAVKQFEEKTGVSFNLLPTKGSTEQKTAILGNHVEVSFMNLSQMLSNHNAGKVRIIAILDDKRASVAPEIKTSLEQNYDVKMTATRGLVISSKVKKEVADKITDLYTKVINDPAFQEKAKKSFIFLNPRTGSEYKSYLQSLQNDTQKVFDKTPW